MQTPPQPCAGTYNLYPGFPVASGALLVGFSALAQQIAGQAVVVIDGYGGVDWLALRAGLDAALRQQGIRAAWLDVQTALLPEAQLDAMLAPFLGGDDPLFGTRFSGTLADFFDSSRLSALRPEPGVHMSILYGPGAALAGWGGLLVYVDVPKYEIQLRSRAGKTTNLGAAQPADPKKMYKRFYFVDWVALNRHKAALLPQIDLFVDAQVRDAPVTIGGGDLRGALSRMSRSYFRVRPWFEPGPWGGQWMKERIPDLPQEKPNYAWSFELIVPENGLLLAADGLLLECSFDLLMFQEAGAVLGQGAQRFGVEFPIRFDFLDTFDGGNLSLQCHPRPEYIKTHFGEAFTQDECYYILDCKPGAQVYLGFQEDIDPPAFRAALERSYAEAVPVDVERFVHTEPASKHDLFLIPAGTIHCSGANNMVLEISSTPYIFTFKMYDWLRLDLDGRPRPLNIARAFENLYFDRKGQRVQQELISQPRIVSRGADWELWHLPTHPNQFYDVYRVQFHGRVTIPTRGSCQVMSLVEGTTVMLETADGQNPCFNYAETFVVPAAAGSVTLVNTGAAPAMVVMAFLKPETGAQEPEGAAQ